MSAAETLRPKRKALVMAAEAVAKIMFASGRIRLKKAQLNHLISVCTEAECVEEIENYLRYQAARSSNTGWSPEIAKSVIDGPKAALQGIDETLGREAWRLYAIFLTRAFTYQLEVSRASSRGAHD